MPQTSLTPFLKVLTKFDQGSKNCNHSKARVMMTGPRKFINCKKSLHLSLNKKRPTPLKSGIQSGRKQRKKLHINFMRNFLFHQCKFFVSFRFAEIFKMLKFTIERSWSKKKMFRFITISQNGAVLAILIS